MTIRTVRQINIKTEIATKSLKPLKESIILVDQRIKQSIITVIAKSAGVSMSSFDFAKNLIIVFHTRTSSPVSIIKLSGMVRQ